MDVRYEYLCGECRARFESDQSEVHAAMCPQCEHPAITLTAMVVNGTRRPTPTSLVAFQGGRRWLGGCCSK